MSKPRQVLPGKTRLFTRRVIERRFFLKPSPAVNQLVEYLLAVGCRRFGLLLISVYVGSNHVHILAVDVFGLYPAFLQWFHSLLARAVNRHRGRTDRVWDVQQANAPELADADAVLDRACYVLANPVKDGLVGHGREWLGVRSTPQACTQPPKVVARPGFFFDEDSKTMPEEAELVFSVPPEYAHLGADGWAKLFAERLAIVEQEARDHLAAQGRTFLGARGIKRQCWTSRPKTRAPRGPDQVLHPLVISRHTAIRIDWLRRHLEFTRAHEAARLALLGRQPEVLFPYGTYQHRVVGAVRCRPPP